MKPPEKTDPAVASPDTSGPWSVRRDAQSLWSVRKDAQNLGSVRKDAQKPGGVPKDALRLNVRLTPKARRVGILGIQTDGDGLSSLKVAVSAPPENGKANAALIETLAKALGIPKRDISIVQGETDRRKVIEIAHDCKTIIASLENILKNASQS